MLVSNSLLRYTQKNINILYSHSDNRSFIKILNHLYGADHVGLLEESTFSHNGISLIICNNRMDSLEMCVSLCHYFHAPILIVDHKIKPEHLHINKIEIPNITNYQVAISEQIADSWHKQLYNAIINTDSSDNETIKLWKKCIDHISSQPFKLITKNNEKEYSNIN